MQNEPPWAPQERGARGGKAINVSSYHVSRLAYNGPKAEKINESICYTCGCHQLLCQDKHAGIPSPLDKLFQNTNKTSLVNFTFSS
jgi:hypothetical protein